MEPANNDLRAIGRNDRALHEAGWTVLRVWEQERTEDMADRVQGALDELRTPTLVRGPSLGIVDAAGDPATFSQA
jgi:G:T-mismatch repair DNA endonuclease (very short patch repair protein)